MRTFKEYIIDNIEGIYEDFCENFAYYDGFDLSHLKHADYHIRDSKKKKGRLEVYTRVLNKGAKGHSWQKTGEFPTIDAFYRKKKRRRIMSGAARVALGAGIGLSLVKGAKVRKKALVKKALLAKKKGNRKEYEKILKKLRIYKRL